jgi:hypothetical protein
MQKPFNGIELPCAAVLLQPVYSGDEFWVVNLLNMIATGQRKCDAIGG